MKTTANGTTAAQVNKNNQNKVCREICINFEHDGRMNAEEARDYIITRVINYANAHAHTIEEGTRIISVQDLGEPIPETETPTFEQTARATFAEAADQGINPDTLAKAIGEQLSRTLVEAYGKGEDAAYLLNAIAYHVQSWCNSAL